jgi:hypothetical protein
MTLSDRFWSKVDQSGTCWLWTGYIDSHTGYGRLSAGDGGSPLNAHVFSYVLHNGPVPPGMELDHTCHSNDPTCPGGLCIHRRCVRPDHLEAVPHRENALRGRSLNAENARKTLCSKGHKYTPENTITDPKTGKRRCRECDKARKRADYAANSDAILARQRETYRQNRKGRTDD